MIKFFDFLVDDLIMCFCDFSFFVDGDEFVIFLFNFDFEFCFFDEGFGGEVC